MLKKLFNKCISHCMFIEINHIINLSHCFKYWSGNAPGRSARSRPRAAARLAPVAPRTRANGFDTFSNCFNLLQHVSIRFITFQYVPIFLMMSVKFFWANFFFFYLSECGINVTGKTHECLMNVRCFRKFLNVP